MDKGGVRRLLPRRWLRVGGLALAAAVLVPVQSAGQVLTTTTYTVPPGICTVIVGVIGGTGGDGGSNGAAGVVGDGLGTTFADASAQPGSVAPGGPDPQDDGTGQALVFEGDPCPTEPPASTPTPGESTQPVTAPAATDQPVTAEPVVQPGPARPVAGTARFTG